MKVSPISLSSAYTNKKLSNHHQAISTMNDSFVKTNIPSFSANDRYFKDAEDRDIDGFWDYRTLYYDLIDEIYSQDNVSFYEGSSIINNKSSLKDILDSLCDPSFSDFESSLVNKAKENPLTVVHGKGQPLISIKVTSPHSFIDLLTGNEDVLNTKIVFHEPDRETRTIEFGLDEDGDLLIEKPFEEIAIWRDTWKLKKKVVHNSDYSGSKTTYYNKDGSERFWKSFFDNMIS